MADHVSRKKSQQSDSGTTSSQPPHFGLTKLLVVRLALPHVCLLTLSVLYCAAGAVIFVHLERSQGLEAAEAVNQSIHKNKHLLIAGLRNLSVSSELEFRRDGERMLRDFTDQLYILYKKLDKSGFDTSIRDKWSFSRAFFFAATTLTSIGYGNQTPGTDSGKLFCIFFVLVGLPLVVITVADVAKFVSELVLFCFAKYLTIKCWIQARFRQWRSRRRRRRASLRRERSQRLASANGGPDADAIPKGDSDEEVAEFLWLNLENAKFVEVPGALMLALLVGYVTLGGLLFVPFENWTFFEGFYFSVVSILAVGLGDYTPKNELYLLFSLMYIIFGLILTTTCIDIVGVEYLNKLHFWGRQLHRVDPLRWLKAVQERRLRNMKRKAMMALFNTLSVLQHMRVDPSILNNLEDTDRSDETALRTALSSQHASSTIGDQKLLETVSSDIDGTIVIQLKECPSEPRNFRAIKVSTHSVTVGWESPIIGADEDLHYTLSYRVSPLLDTGAKLEERMAMIFSDKPAKKTSVDQQSLLQCPELTVEAGRSSRKSMNFMGFKNQLLNRLAPKRSNQICIDRLSSSMTSFTISGLKSFTLYHISLVAANSVGRSKPVYVQEYTEPSTVPLNIRAEVVLDSMARISWDPPARNKNGPRRYTVHVSSDVNRPFSDWQRIEAGHQLTADLMQLTPTTKYVVCVSANHNRGLATFSRSLQLVTVDTSAHQLPDEHGLVWHTSTDRLSSSKLSVTVSDRVSL